jgi:hypothetical protein
MLPQLPWAGFGLQVTACSEDWAHSVVEVGEDSHAQDPAAQNQKNHMGHLGQNHQAQVQDLHLLVVPQKVSL